MKINRLVIENFKSIERIELIEPNPFTVFVGPNGSGKSNIFEALEFVNLRQKMRDEIAVSLFGGYNDISRRQSGTTLPSYEITADRFAVDPSGFSLFPDPDYRDAALFQPKEFSVFTTLPEYDQFIDFTHLFIGSKETAKLLFTDGHRISAAAGNMETVLKRLLDKPVVKDELFEWLDLFIPGFSSVEVVEGSLDGNDRLLVYEKGVDKPFTRSLISDGTYNILALLTAVYQSDDKPQFLCIEEPENGLHPQVLMSLVDFFRQQCKEKGHYIWLNTHSESMVRGLTTDEIILVNKVDGATQTRQIKGRDLYDLPTDEAWLTGALGGGLPW